MWFSTTVALCLFSLGVSGFSFAGPDTVQDDTSQVEIKVPLNRTVPIPCVGGDIRLSGNIRAQFRVKPRADSDPSVEADFDFSGISGVGLPDEVQYRANGTSHLDSDLPSERGFPYVSNFVLNRLNSTVSLMGQVKMQISVNKKGRPSVVVREVNLDCP